MKKSDVKYYADQINSFTPCRAVEMKNYITVTFPDGKRVLAKTEDRADELYRECGNLHV